MEGTWTITELAGLAGAALADEPVRVNGRVRELPNERLIRWYTTIGLLDPPVARRGRTALYGPRHLLQLVAVKRRQAAGLAIAEIQTELTGATDATLRDIARLPETVVPAAPAAQPVRRSQPRGRFWAEPPASPQTPSPQTPSVQIRSVRAVAAHEMGEAGGPAAAPSVVPGIRLAAGVTLLLDGSPHAVSAADLAAIGAAARPLLDELRRRGLLPESPAPGKSPDPPTSPGPTSPGRQLT